MKNKKFIHILLIILLFCQSVLAQVQLNDSAKVSLLTASPWHGAIYSLFGHTAIRVHDDSTGVDAVFNYGYFDSTQPNFIYNFVRGETDYVLGVDTFEDFLYEYRYKGQEVVEQTLNLTAKDKQQLYDALYINSLPENMRYRYDFLFDNCATRPRDMIESYTDGTIIYPETEKEQTFRDLIHECVHYYPWIEFGIDLIIGSDADRAIDVREKMYIPAYLMDSFEGAIVNKNDTLQYNLVSNSEIVLQVNTERNSAREASVITPLVIAFVILIITVLISILQFMSLNKSRVPKIYDTLLFGVVGIGGIVVMTLMFFSEHPATNPNWNFAWLNIFALFAAILIWVNSAKNIVYFYHFINFAVLTLYILLWWLIPQQMPIATIPFVLSIWVRSGANLLIIRKKRVKNSRFTSSRELKAGWGQ